MTWLKDLVFTRNNVSLDIARLSSLLGVLTFLGASIWQAWVSRAFDPVTFGTGWTALCAGCGGWIYARQKYEGGERPEGSQP